MPVHTLPDGYVWLGDAFERAWSEIEGNDFASSTEPAPAFSAAVGGENWHYETSHADDLARATSRKRVEKLMRTALAYGGEKGLRPLIRDPQTGQPSEVADREEWVMKVSVGFDGLRTKVCHLTSPGPETGGRPVFVSERELQGFISRYSPQHSPMAMADLIDREPWATPLTADVEALAALPGGDWITLPRVINFLAFGQPTPPDDSDPLVTLAHQRRAFGAMLERARNGRLKMAGAAGVGPSEVPPFVFAQELVPTSDLDGFDVSPGIGNQDSYEAWRAGKSRGLLWHNVTVERASLNAWVADLSRPSPKPERKRGVTSADIATYLADNGGVWGSVRETVTWFKNNRPECTKGAVEAAHKAHAPRRRPGPNNRG